ncbi:MAG: type 2 isopentenyl-diphosphate Delta-isomerase [Cyanobacteria bacterium REEB65]|nr:type 2 isopentenyl-diphosphate Delta-isomerase [Cyanobacteria bacterium REEB65]
MTDITQRKRDHLDLCLTQNMAMDFGAGFDAYRFGHNALPELALADISLETTFLGKAIGAPILLSCMTGGPQQGETINRNLAAAAQHLRLPVGLGSQRVAFVDPSARQSFAVARQAAPDVLLIGNLGAVQLNYGFTAATCEEAVRSIGADALYLHLNSLQEAIQPEGDTNFRGLLAKISSVCQAVDFPVLIKEVGCGIAPEVAVRLANAGVAAIDVAGAGGTSWSRIEAHRSTDPTRRTLGEVFANWGIPTAACVVGCRAALPEIPLIASGGIRTGLDAAKAIALGADLVGLAMPLLKPATQSAAAVIATLEQFMAELRTAMFLLGIASISSLRRSRHLIFEVR